MEKEKEEFKPFVPAEKEMKEFSITAVIVGVLLAVVFGAANAYLGLRVGMTVSASIPAAVVSMGILRGLLRRNSILESNLVQTIGSAGESLAAGAIFTLPALFLWAEEGKAETPDLFTSTCFVWRRSWRAFYGSAAQSINCKRTWGASISGRNGVCGCAASR